MTPIILFAILIRAPIELLFVENVANSDGQSYNQLISIKGNQIDKSMITDRGWISTKEFSAEAKEKYPEYLVLHWRNYPTTVEILNAPIRGIECAQEGKYLLVKTRRDGDEQSATSIFRKNGASLSLVRNCDRDVISVINDCTLGFSKRKSGEVDFLAKRLKDDQIDQVLNQKANQLYLSRTNYCRQDRFKDFKPPEHHSEIIISPNCSYWFEKETRIFISQGMNDTIHFAAHTIYDRNGLVAQWKYSFDSMRGAHFVNDHTFRFLCSEGFVFGKVMLKEYEFGVYDLNVKTSSLTKIDFPILSRDQLQKLELIPNF